MKVKPSFVEICFEVKFTIFYKSLSAKLATIIGKCCTIIITGIKVFQSISWVLLILRNWNREYLFQCYMNLLILPESRQWPTFCSCCDNENYWYSPSLCVEPDIFEISMHAWFNTEIPKLLSVIQPVLPRVCCLN